MKITANPNKTKICILKFILDNIERLYSKKLKLQSQNTSMVVLHQDNDILIIIYTI